MWEEPIRQWANAQGFPDETEAVIPQATDDVHRPELAPQVTITSPTPRAIYKMNDRITVAFGIQTARFPVNRADFFLNNNFLGSSRQAPFNFSISPQEIEEAVKDINELKVVVYDSVENQTTIISTINIKID